MIGATNVAGTPFRIGCAGSSAFTRAGIDGQLLALNLPPPMNSVNHGQAFVTEPGHVESEPAASIPDVPLERQALRRRVRHIVQPNHDTYNPEIRVVQCVPIAGRGKRVAARLRGGAERPHRLLREQEVIELATGREKRQHLRTGGLGLLREQGWRGKKGGCNAADRQ